jgi:CubicO group peptidase (beta-lactamase class C family)
MTVQGSCEPRFAQVAEEFERNLAERGEVGASVCVILDGQVAVDLWGGEAAPGVPWLRDTIGHVWSCTKGATERSGTGSSMVGFGSRRETDRVVP